MSSENNAEKELHDIIQGLLPQSQSKSLHIKSIVERFSKLDSTFSEKINKDIHQRILDLIGEINFFDVLSKPK